MAEDIDKLYDWIPYSSHEDDKDDEEDDKYAEYFDN